MGSKLGLAAFLVMTLVISATPASAATQSSATYDVVMSDVVGAGLRTDCGGGADGSLARTGKVVAREQTGAGKTFLHANGNDLNLDLVNTGIVWARKYDAGHGTSGVFNGCYGVTTDYDGDLFLSFEGNSTGSSTLRFVWHFEYWGTPGITPREYFTVEVSKIPYPKWQSGASVAGWVRGTFPVRLSLYDSSTKGISGVQQIGGAYLEFYLSITKNP